MFGYRHVLSELIWSKTHISCNEPFGTNFKRNRSNYKHILDLAYVWASSGGWWDHPMAEVSEIVYINCLFIFLLVRYR